MSTKNYALSGVASEVELGKRGSKLKNNAGVIEARKANNDLAEMKVADATTDDSVVTLRQLKKHGGLIITGQIDGGAPPVVVDGANYVVTISGGTYTAGEVYRGENGVWVLVPIQDGYPINIADALTGGSIEFSANHIYNWDADTTSWINVGPVTEKLNLLTKYYKFSDMEPVFSGSLKGLATFLFDNVVPDGYIFLRATMQLISSDLECGGLLSLIDSVRVGDACVLGFFNGGDTSKILAADFNGDGGSFGNRNILDIPLKAEGYPIGGFFNLSYSNCYLISGQIDGNNPPPVVVDAFYHVGTTGGTFIKGEIYKGVPGTWVKQNLPVGTLATGLFQNQLYGFPAAGVLKNTALNTWELHENSKNGGLYNSFIVIEYCKAN